MANLKQKSLSRHAETRLQQRGISERTLDYLQEYGEESYAPGGATKITLSRRARDRIISINAVKANTVVRKRLA